MAFLTKSTAVEVEPVTDTERLRELEEAYREAERALTAAHLTVVANNRERARLASLRTRAQEKRNQALLEWSELKAVAR